MCTWCVMTWRAEGTTELSCRHPDAYIQYNSVGIFPLKMVLFYSYSFSPKGERVRTADKSRICAADYLVGSERSQPAGDIIVAGVDLRSILPDGALKQGERTRLAHVTGRIIGARDYYSKIYAPLAPYAG